MKISINNSDDYSGAGFKVNGAYVDFYYGYEDEKDGEWCFTATVDDEDILQLTTSEIEEECTSLGGNYPQDYLVAGIILFFIKKIAE